MKNILFLSGPQYYNIASLPVSDESPVLHGSRGEIRNGDRVQLVDGFLCKRHVNDTLYCLHCLLHDTLGVLGLLHVIAPGPHSEIFITRQRLELGQYERQEVGAHARRRGERQFLRVWFFAWSVDIQENSNN